MTDRKLVNALDAGSNMRVEFPPAMKVEFMRRLMTNPHPAHWSPEHIDQFGRLFLECMEVYEGMKR